MSGRIPRVIGTTENAIAKAEKETNFRFPPSFRAWLLENNGLHLDGVELIYPFFDERDPRKTSDSIASNFRGNWADWLEIFAEDESNFENILPFAGCGNGDFYCFDYRPGLTKEYSSCFEYIQATVNEEPPIVLWLHETGETEDRAKTFAEFVEKAKLGEYEMD
jgi:hypothetical protein